MSLPHHRKPPTEQEQLLRELAELGNPYAWPQRDWVEDHIRHLAIQRYHALRGEIAAIERQLNREVAR